MKKNKTRDKYEIFFASYLINMFTGYALNWPLKFFPVQLKSINRRVRPMSSNLK